MNNKTNSTNMPHPQAFYLNALNIAFQNNFLKLYPFCSHYSSYHQAWQIFSTSHSIKFSPEKSWQELKERNISFILNSDKKFPLLLQKINYPPLGIYYQGQLSFPMIPIAVVGTRKISNYGQLVTEKIVQELVHYNFLIISGLARGVDTIAHRTTLQNSGKTIAVLGSGFDHVSPPSNRQLARQISKQGAIITEYPLPSLPYPSNFPWRNRIISGLARATLVIEAPEKSGALITAKFALEQNRDVFAIPGSILRNNSRGTNKLIQQGAKLITAIEDILEEFNIPLEKINITPPQLSATETLIYHQLSTQPVSVDKIIANTHLPSAVVLTQLSMLELKKLVKSVSGNYYSKL